MVLQLLAGTVMATAYCTRCDGTAVYYDAYVGINDPDDVRTFDAVYCDDCETRSTVEWRDE